MSPFALHGLQGVSCLWRWKATTGSIGVRPARLESFKHCVMLGGRGKHSPAPGHPHGHGGSTEVRWARSGAWAEVGGDASPRLRARDQVGLGRRVRPRRPGFRARPSSNLEYFSMMGSLRSSLLASSPLRRARRAAPTTRVSEMPWTWQCWWMKRLTRYRMDSPGPCLRACRSEGIAGLF